MEFYDPLTWSMHLGEEAIRPRHWHVTLSYSLTPTAWCYHHLSSATNRIDNDSLHEPNQTNYGLWLSHSNVRMLGVLTPPTLVKPQTSHVIIIWLPHLHHHGSVRPQILISNINWQRRQIITLNNFYEDIDPNDLWWLERSTAFQ